MEFTPNSENQTNPELSQFKDRFSTGLQDALDFFPGDDFLVLQPLNLALEDDTRSIEELSTDELTALSEIVTDHLEVNVEDQESVISFYNFDGPLREDKTPSNVKVSVYATNREELFLHKVKYENGETVYAVGPQDMKFE